jgi:hypothetical protein
LPSTQARLRSAASLAIGTTSTVREPEPSALGPTVSSTILPAVFSKRRNTFSVASSATPSTASRYSPSTTPTPGSVSGERRSGFQLRPPYTLAKR